MYYFLIFSAILLVNSAYGQGPYLTDEGVREKIVAESVRNYLMLYGPCPCPGYKQADGSICTVNGWTASGGREPICYTAQVTPEMIANYRQQVTPGYRPATGVVSETVVRPPLGNIVVTNETDTTKNNFIYNGILYHPLVEEGCNKIKPGMPLTVVNLTYAQKEVYSSNAVIFRLPEGAQCLAISLGPTRL
jgi:hypothetical protein